MPAALVQGIHQHRRQIDRRVVVAVAHPGAIEQQRVIQQRPVTVRRVPHLLHELGEQGHVIGVDLGTLRNLHRIHLMMRHLEYGN